MELVQTAAAYEGPQRKKYWWQKAGELKKSCTIPARPGQTCAQCGRGRLDYDGLFLLTCAACGYIAEGGAFT